MCKLRNIHKSFEDKNINLRLTDLKYAGADHDGITYSQLKKWILKFCQYHEAKRKEGHWRTQQDVLRTCHIDLTFGDEKCKHSTFAKEQSLEIR